MWAYNKNITIDAPQAWTVRRKEPFLKIKRISFIESNADFDEYCVNNKNPLIDCKIIVDPSKNPKLLADVNRLSVG